MTGLHSGLNASQCAIGTTPVVAGIGSGRLLSLNLLRGMAILTVFFYHYSSMIRETTQGSKLMEAAELVISRTGPLGTDLFLVLSGFFVSRSLAGQKWNYTRFLVHRLSVIYVPYACVVLLALALSPLSPYLAIRQASGFSLFRNFLLLPWLFPDPPILRVTWTLAPIVAGYFILPPLLMGLHRLVGPSARSCLVLLGIVLLDVWLSSRTALFSSRPVILLAGCIAWEALSATGNWRDRRWTTAIFLAVGAACILLRATMTYVPTGQAPLVLLSATGLSCLLLGAARLEARHPEWFLAAPSRLLGWLGGIGYSFYLLHGPVAKVFVALASSLIRGVAGNSYYLWALVPICFALAAAASWTLFRLVESPCRNWVASRPRTSKADRRRWPRSDAPTAPQSRACHELGHGAHLVRTPSLRINQPDDNRLAGSTQAQRPCWTPDSPESAAANP